MLVLLAVLALPQPLAVGAHVVVQRRPRGPFVVVLVAVGVDLADHALGVQFGHLPPGDVGALEAHLVGGGDRHVRQAAAVQFLPQVVDDLLLDRLERAGADEAAFGPPVRRVPSPGRFVERFDAAEVDAPEVAGVPGDDRQVLGVLPVVVLLQVVAAVSGAGRVVVLAHPPDRETENSWKTFAPRSRAAYNMARW
ncbi:hypothetical protein [Saccharothrix sp. NRRL B-16348]|uniref:hypothetical protein n=1 Tax=Saccharothrix sp. NRRL B-16348 TaxID=1415542 RepID=UPI0012FAA7D5|nr:hypothetical protein [Saccharothrix sp. NRRL B-16348]